MRLRARYLSLVVISVAACDREPMLAPPLPSDIPPVSAPLVAVNELRFVGVLRDAESGKPIVLGQIFVPAAVRSTAADSTGAFELVIPADGAAGGLDVTVRARAIGYSPVATTLRVTGGQSVTLDVRLKRDVLTSCFLSVEGTPARRR